MTNALAKSKVAWLLVPPDTTVPCWYAATGETAYIVGGDGEQPLPPLPDELRIILRNKETWAPVGPVPARATLLEPGSQDWTTATTALLAARQNNPPGGLAEHWAQRCAVYSLDLSAHHAAPAPPELTTPD